MTLFSINDLPPDITTVEEVHAWSASVLMANYASKVCEESRGNPVREVAITPFFNDSSEYDSEWHWRAIFRLSLPLNSAWLKGGKFYQFVEPLGDLLIPEEFKPPSENLP